MNLHLIAPSGSLPNTDILVNGEAWFKQKNISVTNLECGHRQFQRFAGTDHERLKEINDLVTVSPNQVVMALRGGYGLSRMLDQINWTGIAKQVNQGLKIVGHSDFTAFGLALFAKTGASSFAGPMFSYDFCGDVSEFTWKHFHAAMTEKVIEIEVIAPQVMANPLGVSDAVLWGGNLTMLTSLLGTDYLPSVDQVTGGILFVEDVNEHPYRIERMLQQLIDAGYLARQKAVILGDISSYRLSEVDRGYDLDATIDAIRQRLGDSVPVLTGLPFGHCPDKLTLPVGRRASLFASTSGYILKANCA